MTATYTAGVERDGPRSGRRTGFIDSSVVSIVATSLVAMLAIGLAYAGRTSGAESGGRAAAAAPVNLNTVSDVKTIDAAMEPVIPNADDRRSAAERLFQFLAVERQKARVLPNVGAVAPLFPPAEFAQLKQLFGVRTADEFRRQVVLFACLYFFAFQAATVLWRLRRVRTDPILLAVAHLI